MTDFSKVNSRYSGNFDLSEEEFAKVEKILNDLQDENEKLTEEGYGQQRYWKKVSEDK